MSNCFFFNFFFRLLAILCFLSWMGVRGMGGKLTCILRGFRIKNYEVLFLYTQFLCSSYRYRHAQYKKIWWHCGDISIRYVAIIWGPSSFIRGGHVGNNKLFFSWWPSFDIYRQSTNAWYPTDCFLTTIVVCVHLQITSWQR